jgi:hypothetical protein
MSALGAIIHPIAVEVCAFVKINNEMNRVSFGVYM